MTGPSGPWIVTSLRRVRREQVAQAQQLGRVVPVHPVAEPDALLGLAGGEREHALLAQAHELGDAVRLDVALAREAEVALDVDLDPQALAVEAVLVALVLAQHRVEPLVQVLVRAAPGVVDAHRVVGRDRPVEEAPARAPGVLRPEPRERPPLGPQPEQVVLLGDEVGAACYRCEHRASRGRGPRPGPGSRAGLLVYRLTPRARRPPVFRTRRIIPRDVDTAATPACAAHAICVRRRVPVADLPGPRSRLRRRLDARARVGGPAAAVARAARRDRPAREPHRAARVRGPAGGPVRPAGRQRPDPAVPDPRGHRRLERRALPQRRRRLGHRPRRPGASCR